MSEDDSRTSKPRLSAAFPRSARWPAWSAALDAMRTAGIAGRYRHYRPTAVLAALDAVTNEGVFSRTEMENHFQRRVEESGLVGADQGAIPLWHNSLFGTAQMWQLEQAGRPILRPEARPSERNWRPRQTSDIRSRTDSARLEPELLRELLQDGCRTWIEDWIERFLDDHHTSVSAHDDSPQPGVVPTTIQRVIRNTEVAQAVKEIYKFSCQVCNQTLQTPRGLYAQAAHIRPLGQPHNGPDSAANTLCLCPNHHVLFDAGAFAIADDLSLLGLPGRLILAAGHRIETDHVVYSRNTIFTADDGA